MTRPINKRYQLCRPTDFELELTFRGWSLWSESRRVRYLDTDVRFDLRPGAAWKPIYALQLL
jgi:hypothetical protein